MAAHKADGRCACLRALSSSPARRVCRTGARYRRNRRRPPQVRAGRIHHGPECWANNKARSALPALASASGLVLLVGDWLHPLDVLAVKRFLHSDMNHDGARTGAVPMFFARRNPDHIAGTDFSGLIAPYLNPAAAGNHRECLAERMGVPMSPRTRLEP